MDILDSARNEWSKSRKLSPLQRVIAGVFCVISVVWFLGLHIATPLLNLLAVIPVSLFLLSVSGGPVKKIIGVGLGCALGAVLATLL